MRSGVKLVILFVAALVATEFLIPGRAPVPSGQPAPAFSLPDLQGREVSLAGMEGRVVAVNFWTTWCGACRAEIPRLARVLAANSGKCFELLGIVEESGSPADVEPFVRKLGVSYPVLLDDGGKVGEAYGVSGYPQTFLIDARGKVRRVFAGPVDHRELQEALAPLLAEAPSACPGV